MGGKRMMDAKEAIAALNAGITEAKEHYERRKDEDDVTMIELFSVCVEALEKVETLEAENARLREKETPKEEAADDCRQCKFFMKNNSYGLYQCQITKKPFSNEKVIPACEMFVNKNEKGDK